MNEDQPIDQQPTKRELPLVGEPGIAGAVDGQPSVDASQSAGDKDASQQPTMISRKAGRGIIASAAAFGIGLGAMIGGVFRPHHHNATTVAIPPAAEQPAPQTPESLPPNQSGPGAYNTVPPPVTTQPPETVPNDQPPASGTVPPPAS